jgi:hypothetical protein
MLIDHAVHICVIRLANTGLYVPTASPVPLWHINSPIHLW